MNLKTKKQLKNINVSDARILGKDILEDSLKDSGIELKEFPNEQLKQVFTVLGVRSLNQLLVDIGLGKKGVILLQKALLKHFGAGRKRLLKPHPKLRLEARRNMVHFDFQNVVILLKVMLALPYTQS